MSWTINGQSPESLNLSLVQITENSDTSSEVTLSVVAEDYTQVAQFTYGQTVSIKKDGVNVFTGTVFQTPRMASGSEESLEYVLRDSWYDLERLVYQEEREYVKTITPPPEGNDEDSTITFVSSLIGTTTFETDVPLGDRIKAIVDYANSKGLDIQAGNISTGLNWYRTESKDRTCAEMIREILRLMPDHTAWVDNSTTPPSFNMAERSTMPERGFTVGLDYITNHSIQSHESEQVKCVVIRYERPISIDSESYTEIFEDVAPAGADPAQLGTVIETVGLQGGVFQNEYARVTTDNIPQEDAGDDEIKEWYINYTPQFAAIAEAKGLATLRDLLKIPDVNVPAEDVKKHTLELAKRTTPPPEPINPNATPITQTDDVKDYPRHIIEGSLPEWAGVRYRQVRAQVTMAIEQAAFDAIGDAEIKASIGSLLTVPKTFGGTAYLTGLVTGQVMGTNARTKNYTRAVTSNPGESIPTGIAAQLLAELNKVRYSGSLSLVNQEPETTSKVGQKLNILGGRPEWATMDESIQSISRNLQEGTTDITFGPPQNLGANDIIDRLRASRANQFGFGVQSGQPIKEGLGGTSATPVFNFTIDNATDGTSPHPWKVTLAEDNGSYEATILKGLIFDGLLSITKITPTIDPLFVSAGDVIVLKYTYATQAITATAIPSEDYEPFTKIGEDMEATYQPIALIKLESGNLEVEQIARNNFGLTEACKDSQIVKYLTAL